LTEDDLDRVKLRDLVEFPTLIGNWNAEACAEITVGRWLEVGFECAKLLAESYSSEELKGKKGEKLERYFELWGCSWDRPGQIEKRRREEEERARFNRELCSVESRCYSPAIHRLAEEMEKEVKV
jgi:hypothetical protein